MTEVGRAATLAAMRAIGNFVRWSPDFTPESLWGSDSAWFAPCKRAVVCALRELGWSLRKIGGEISRDHKTVAYMLMKATAWEQALGKAISHKLKSLDGMQQDDGPFFLKRQVLSRCVASALIAVLPPPSRAATKTVAYGDGQLKGVVQLIAVQDPETAEWRWSQTHEL